MEFSLGVCKFINGTKSLDLILLWFRPLDSTEHLEQRRALAMQEIHVSVSRTSSANPAQFTPLSRSSQSDPATSSTIISTSSNMPMSRSSILYANRSGQWPSAAMARQMRTASGGVRTCTPSQATGNPTNSCQTSDESSSDRMYRQFCEARTLAWTVQS